MSESPRGIVIVAGIACQQNLSHKLENAIDNLQQAYQLYRRYLIKGKTPKMVKFALENLCDASKKVMVVLPRGTKVINTNYLYWIMELSWTADRLKKVLNPTKEEFASILRGLGTLPQTEELVFHFEALAGRQPVSFPSISTYRQRYNKAMKDLTTALRSFPQSPPPEEVKKVLNEVNAMKDHIGKVLAPLTLPSVPTRFVSLP